MVRRETTVVAFVRADGDGLRAVAAGGLMAGFPGAGAATLVAGATGWGAVAPCRRCGTPLGAGATAGFRAVRAAGVDRRVGANGLGVLGRGAGRMTCRAMPGILRDWDTGAATAGGDGLRTATAGRLMDGCLRTGTATLLTGAAA